MMKLILTDFWLFFFIALLLISIGLFVLDVIVYPFGIFMLLIAIIARSLGLLL